MYININEIDMQVIVVAPMSHIKLSKYALRFLSWLFVNLNTSMIIVCMVKFKGAKL